MSKVIGRVGPGRPYLDVRAKKTGLYIKVSPWVKEWLQSQSKSQGELMEKALIMVHQLKEPEKKV